MNRRDILRKITHTCYLWNSRQNTLVIHWKIRFYIKIKLQELSDTQDHEYFWKGPEEYSNIIHLKAKTKTPWLL